LNSSNSTLTLSFWSVTSLTKALGSSS